MKFPIGTRLKSTVDTTEVVVVKAPNTSVDIRCGGSTMVHFTQVAAPATGRVDPRFEEGTDVGKRYVHDERGVELLCTKAGNGTLSLGDELFKLKAAKQLPSSD
jgi:hypothetical protein